MFITYREYPVMTLQQSINLVAPTHPLSGRVALPLSKSMSTRMLVLAHLGQGRIKHGILADNQDVRDLGEILDILSREETAILDAGDGGAVLRFAMAVAAITPGLWRFTGSERLHERPVGILVEALRECGADIQFQDRQGYLPLRIRGGKCSGGKVKVDAGESSQHISSLCLVAPFFQQGLELHMQGEAVSEPYIRMTLEMMEKAGYRVSRNDKVIQIKSGIPGEVHFDIEPDWSAAAFMYSACALSPGSRLFMPGLSQHSVQGDRRCASLFKALGVLTRFEEDGALIWHEPSISELRADLRDCPDLMPALAVAAAGRLAPAWLSGLSHLRIKESDRLQTVCDNLQLCGFEVEVGDDAIRIAGQARPASMVQLSAWNDHRIAMAFAILSLKMEYMVVKGAQVVDKSWPGFWQNLGSLGWKTGPAV